MNYKIQFLLKKIEFINLYISHIKKYYVPLRFVKGARKC